MKQLIVATKNKGKIREFKEMLGDSWEVRSLIDLNDQFEVIEDGDTFEANAKKKALEVSAEALKQGYDGYVIADDSGLEVDVLQGEPGVYSARYAGEACDDALNNEKLLHKMEGLEQRGAQFHCVLALVRGDQVLQTFEGIVRGEIVDKLYGSGGFGYDPMFKPDGYEQTFGILSSEIKHAISHRGKALRELIHFLKEL
ncbi:MAG: RdgB/HAM1 family non-canonical purine NTP pyrophosphatase [Verrucomicrobiota bacterium]